MLSAILLAAGESKRMGKQDKLFLKYKGDWIINHVMRALWASKKSELIIVMQNNDVNLLNGHTSDEIRVAINPDFKKGMTTSIKAGIKSSYVNSNGYMICLADQPLMTKEDYNEIIDRFELIFTHDPKCIIVPTFMGQKGNPVIFSKEYRDAILQHEEMDGCKKIVKANQSHVYTIEMYNNHVIRDVDTPEDFEKLVV